MTFYYQTGKMALGTRLRRLGERFQEEAARIYALYGVPLEARWFPVFYVLSQHEAMSITEIAQIIDHSHPWVSQVVKEMARNGWAITAKSPSDGRVNIVRLSEAGRQLLPKLEHQYRDVSQAVEELLGEMQHDLWQAIEETEFLLARKDFYTRVREKRKARESGQVEIIAYAPEFQEDFKRLNYEWIERHFNLEESDHQSLNDPVGQILEPGGFIFLARYKDEIVGTRALIKMDDDSYELVKMAVTETAKGKGIGWLLGQTAIATAREQGAKTIFLESNTILTPAINLYHKLGFQKVVGRPSPYKRCNIQMELQLDERSG